MSSYAEDSLAQYTRVRRIKELFDGLERVYGELERDYKRIASENAGLRELVRDLYRCVANIGNYDAFYYAPSKPGCGVDCAVNGEGCCLRTFERRIRDLGVEADG